jgi:hypothetical protein
MQQIGVTASTFRVNIWTAARLLTPCARGAHWMVTEQARGGKHEQDLEQ